MRGYRFWLFLALALLVMGAACLHGLPGGHGPVSRFVDFQGGRVHYVDTGGDGVPLVLVHGWGGDVSFWTGQREPLSVSRRVIVVDLPGHGRSDPVSGPYTLDLFADAVAAVMDHAGVERAALAGHSMGGAVIRRLALARPGRVAALILVDGAMLFPPEDPEAERAWSREMQAFVDGFRGEKGEAFVAAFIDSLYGQDTPESLKTWILEKVLSTPRAVRLSAMENMIDPAAWRGGPVRAPTLAVYAVSDHLPPDFEALLRALFPDLTFLFRDGSGHFLQLEDPGRLNAAIFDFLSSHGL